VKHRIGAVLLVVASVLPTGACSTMTGPVKQGSPLRNLNLVARSADAQVEVVDVVQPGDATAWTDRASWTEVVVRVKNLSTRNISIGSATLVDGRGVALPPVITPMPLIASSAATESAPSGILDMAGTAASAAAGLASGIGGVASSLPMIGSMVSIGAQLGSGAMSMARSRAATDAIREPQLIQAEIERRMLRSDTVLVPGGAVEGSLFFRSASSPQRLVLIPEAGQKLRPVEIQLASQAGRSGL